MMTATFQGGAKSRLVYGSNCSCEETKYVGHMSEGHLTSARDKIELGVLLTSEESAISSSQ